jgi:hypothetical protein
MNSPNDEFNITEYIYLTVDEVLSAFGSTWAMDCLNFYMFTIVSIMGFFMSILSFKVFNQRDFNLALYSYLRVYTVGNMITSFVSIFNFLGNSYQILPWSNGYWPQAYFNFILIPVTCILYFYGSVLNIFILLDRIAYFNKTVNKFFTLPPYKICAISFVAVFVIDMPFYFQFVPLFEIKRIDANTTFTIWFSGNSEFINSHLGKILTYVLVSIRDLGIVIVEIILNITSIVLLKQHFEKKKQIAAPTHLKNTESSHSLNGPTNRNASETEGTANQHGTSVSRKCRSSGGSRAEQRATLMCIILCVFSIMNHVVMFTCIIYPYFSFDFNVFILYLLADFFFTLRTVLDFLIFFFFNKIFRKKCFEIFSSLPLFSCFRW